MCELIAAGILVEPGSPGGHLKGKYPSHCHLMDRRFVNTMLAADLSIDWQPLQYVEYNLTQVVEHFIYAVEVAVF
ncbi:unnamed protein product [Taenia asiatica]|uniref:Phosphoenolpyruvate carboxylase n=1 Tax=Taenia asiatica TaxID=60517 RepID=A0A0R3VXX2_TAEAS|nr:unnamed protein product [Taenia asiatica]